MTVLKIWWLYVIAGVIVLSVLVTTYRNSTETHVLTQTKPLVQGIPTEVHTVKAVVLKKDAAELRLRVKLPDGNSITSTADLKPSETGYGVLSVLDENTGVTTLQQYEKPRSAIGFPMSGRCSAGIGYGTSGAVQKVAVAFTPLRVQSVYITGELEGRLSATRAPEAIAWVLAEVKF